MFENNTFNKGSIAIAVITEEQNLCFCRLYHSSMTSTSTLLRRPQGSSHSDSSVLLPFRPTLKTTATISTLKMQSVDHYWPPPQMRLRRRQDGSGCEVTDRGLISPGRVTWVRVYDVRSAGNITDDVPYVASCAWCIWKTNKQINKKTWNWFFPCLHFLQGQCFKNLLFSSFGRYYMLVTSIIFVPNAIWTSWIKR